MPRLALDKMAMCLSKSAESRKYAISLENIEYSGGLAKQMMLFSGKLEKIYKILQDLTKRKINSEEMYEKHFAIIADKLAWFESAEARFAFFNVLCFDDIKKYLLSKKQS